MTPRQSALMDEGVQRVVRLAALLLLGFVGLNAIAGGYVLIVDPTGEKMGLALSYLRHSPFRDYTIPGALLLASNGIPDVAAMVALIVGWKHSSLLVLIQGCVLSGWIIIQILTLHFIFFLHIVLGGMGMLMTIFGIVLSSRTSRNAEQ
ncbi:MAG TPA: hypothetical protein VMM57_00890 [Bacteroidota bacterium]|nr:hypothetical protein [Bacteroidota bacterium]